MKYFVWKDERNLLDVFLPDVFQLLLRVNFAVKKIYANICLLLLYKDNNVLLLSDYTLALY